MNTHLADSVILLTKVELVNRRLLIIVGLIMSGLLIGWTIFSYLTSFQDLTISFPHNTNRTVRVYEVPKGVDAHSVIEQKTDNLQKAELTNTQTLRVKKGTYIIYGDETSDYEHFESIIQIGDEAASTQVSSFFSEARLEELLAKEKGKIEKAIVAQIPAIKSGFIFDEGKLFNNGEWYAATIRQKLTSEQARLTYVDVFRVVAKNENGNWELATNPPDLVISKHIYPDIPEMVLRYINDKN